MIGGVYGDHGEIFFKENFIFQKKKSPPCRFHDQNPKDSSEIWRGWQWRERYSPVHMTVKNAFLTVRPGQKTAGVYVHFSVQEAFRFSKTRATRISASEISCFLESFSLKTTAPVSVTSTMVPALNTG